MRKIHWKEMFDVKWPIEVKSPMDLDTEYGYPVRLFSNISQIFCLIEHIGRLLLWGIRGIFWYILFSSHNWLLCLPSPWFFFLKKLRFSLTLKEYRISENSFPPSIFHSNYPIYEVKNCHNAARGHSSITSSKRWVGGVRKWQFVMIYSTVNHQRGGWVGLKKSKT